MPPEIVKCNKNDYSLGIEVIKAIKSSGFNINNDKVSFRTNFDRQQVTGLVVNKKINIPRNYYDFSKSMAYSYCQYAIFNKSSYHTFSNKSSNQGESIIGILNYIYNIKMEYKNRITDKEPYIYTEFKIEKNLNHLNNCFGQKTASFVYCYKLIFKKVLFIEKNTFTL